MSTDTSQFRIGDRVRVRDRAGGTVWTIDGDDANQTPVHDPEPAYRLVRAESDRIAIRYAYASDLLLAQPEI